MEAVGNARVEMEFGQRGSINSAGIENLDRCFVVLRIVDREEYEAVIFGRVL